MQKSLFPGFYLFGFLLVCPGVASAITSEKQCLTAFQARQFVRAAACFAQVVKEQQPTTGRKAEIARGRWIRNIALSLSMAAQHSKEPGVAGYHREQAVQWLQRYQKEKLYENRHRRDSALLMQLKLRRQIQYTSLSVVSHRKAVHMTIRGYKFLHRGQDHVVLEVRPGRYQILLADRSAKQLASKEVDVKPGRPAMVSFARPQGAIAPASRPAVQRRQTRVKLRAMTRPLVPRLLPAPAARSTRYVVGWSLLATGLAVGIAGGIAYGIGRSSADQRTQLHQLASANPTIAQSEEIYDLEQRGRWMMPLGVGLFGLAGACLTSGVVLFAMLNM